MNATLLETRNLVNGTTLHLYDASRRQAADRWIVTLEARLDIPVDENTFAVERPEGVDLQAVRKMLGDQVTYVSRKERVFVSDRDKERLLQAFRNEFGQTALAYLSRPAFAARFIRKQYREACEKQAWQEPLANPHEDHD